MEPAIKATYIDTGKVRLVWHNFAWISDATRRAAHASACAHEQGKFWEYHDQLFEHRGFTEPSLTGYAATVGLNQEQFAGCMKENRYASAIEQEFEEGRKLGVRGTPTFFINGKMVVAPGGIERWTELIEAALAEKR